MASEGDVLIQFQHIKKQHVCMGIIYIIVIKNQIIMELLENKKDALSKHLSRFRPLKIFKKVEMFLRYLLTLSSIGRIMHI